MNQQVDFYFSKGRWQQELQQLRNLALQCGLQEELKWGCPCYTLGKSNIVLIHAFKEYCAFLFFKGALIIDPNKILIQQTKNVQSARQIRFTAVSQIVEMESILKAYIHNAIEVEKNGLKLELKKTEDFKMPEEFQSKIEAMRDLYQAFNKLTPGRQRAYLLYFSQPKQSKTRESRIEKYIPLILSGKGLRE